MTTILTESLNEKLRLALKQTFIEHYQRVYAEWTEEQLGFPPADLSRWLEKQFQENVGEWFLLLHNNPDFFITFTINRDSGTVDIYQLVGDAKQSRLLLAAVARLYPNTAFYGAVRKGNASRIAYCLRLGCHIVENRFLQYEIGSTQGHYQGVYMPAAAVAHLSKRRKRRNKIM